MTDSPPRLSLSDMAVQMENLIHTLIPFKTTQLDQFRQNKELDLKQSAAWWDGMIASLECELQVLRDHAAALGMETNPVPPHERELDAKPNPHLEFLADNEEENLNGPHI